MDHNQNQQQVPPYSSYYGAPPLNANVLRGYRPFIQNTPQGRHPRRNQFLPLDRSQLKYWELLSPALLGAVVGIFLSAFSANNQFDNSDDHSDSDDNHPPECSGEIFFKLVLVGYAIGSSVAVSFAITNVLNNSKSPHDHLVYPVIGALVTVILLFAAEYLLLYRILPSSFKGDVGNNYCTQLVSFIYLSVTSIATGNLGDIMPANLTARVLIATEMAFYLLTMATMIQLILARF